MIPLLAALACSSPSDPTDGLTQPTDPFGGTPTDTSTFTTPTVTVPAGLHGTEPAAALPPPTFTQVTSRHGNPVSQADLLGQPTVMWFYPAAFTGG